MHKKTIMMETTLIVQNAMEAFESDEAGTGALLLKQQADTILWTAVQTNDAELREKAYSLYKLLDFLTSSNGASGRRSEQ